jgi:hypothetical protein
MSVLTFGYFILTAAAAVRVSASFLDKRLNRSAFFRVEQYPAALLIETRLESRNAAMIGIDGRIQSHPIRVSGIWEITRMRPDCALTPETAIIRVPMNSIRNLHFV